MPVTRRPGLDAVIKMATATAQKHVDASPNDLEANSELREAIASTWGLVKGCLGSGSPEAAELDGLIAKLVEKPSRGKPQPYRPTGLACCSNSPSTHSESLRRDWSLAENE